MDPANEIMKINILEHSYNQLYSSGDHGKAEVYSEMERNFLDGLDNKIDNTTPVETTVRVDRDYDLAAEYLLGQSSGRSIV